MLLAWKFKDYLLLYKFIDSSSDPPLFAPLNLLKAVKRPTSGGIRKQFTLA